MIKFFPSLIAANLMNLEREIKLIEPYCAGFHLDVMDFHFVPNLTWGPAFINSIRAISRKQIHVHLMVEFPEKYIDRFMLNPGDVIFVHVESPKTITWHAFAEKIRSRNLKFGLALNPSTPIESVISLPVEIDYVLPMTVQPGFSGQKFLSCVVHKIKALAQLRSAHKYSFLIAADGGINKHTLKQVVDAGATEVAIASAIFDNSDRVSAIKDLEQELSA